MEQTDLFNSGYINGDGPCREYGIQAKTPQQTVVHHDVAPGSSNGIFTGNREKYGLETPHRRLPKIVARRLRKGKS